MNTPELVFQKKRSREKDKLSTASQGNIRR